MVSLSNHSGLSPRASFDGLRRTPPFYKKWGMVSFEPHSGLSHARPSTSSGGPYRFFIRSYGELRTISGLSHARPSTSSGGPGDQIKCMLLFCGGVLPKVIHLAGVPGACIAYAINSKAHHIIARLAGEISNLRPAIRKDIILIPIA